MRMSHRFLPSLLAFAALTGCGVHAPATTASVKVATTSQARVFDRIEARVSHEQGTELAMLEFTCKGLMSQFTDDDVTVFAPIGKDETQQNLFCSKVFLGQDGRLYLSDRAKPNARPRFYEIGSYDMFRAEGDVVHFQLHEGMKLEARGRSITPVGSGPFLALVVPDRPEATTNAPNLVR